MTTTELVYTTALVPSALVRHDENDFEPVARGHHSKTLDFGHQGTTVSAGLVGDVGSHIFYPAYSPIQLK